MLMAFISLYLGGQGCAGDQLTAAGHQPEGAGPPAGPCLLPSAHWGDGPSVVRDTLRVQPVPRAAALTGPSGQWVWCSSHW